MIAKSRGGEVDKTIKYTYVFATKAGIDPSNKRLMYELAQCLLMNFDPITMTVSLPDVFRNIKAKNPEYIEIVNAHNLPRTNISIQANKMIGPSNVK